MDLSLDHTIISRPVPIRPIHNSYFDNSVYQFTPKCMDFERTSVLLTLTKADSFSFTFNIN
jgi:hypothetical protein